MQSSRSRAFASRTSSGTADRMLRLMCEWVVEAGECGSTLMGLAEEPESLRKGYNIAETVGSAGTMPLSVSGIEKKLAGLALAPFTGGLSLFGAEDFRAEVSPGTKVTERDMFSSKLEQVKEMDMRCNKITAEIQNRFYDLREQCSSSCEDERNVHAVKEFLKATLRQSRLDVGKDVNDWVNSIVTISALALTQTQNVPLITEVLQLLSVFSLNPGGTLLWETPTGVQVSQRACGVCSGCKQTAQALSVAKATGKTSAKFLGVEGLAFSLSEEITKWTAAIQQNHQTEASAAITEKAKEISEVIKKVARSLLHISEVLKAKVCEKKKSSDDEEAELQMALINCRSANKWIRPRDRALIDLIEENDLDVLLMTETWFSPTTPIDDIRSILPRSHDIIHQPRPEGRGGGVAIVYRKSLTCVPVYLGTQVRAFEFVGATVTPPCSLETFLIISIYRQPKSPHFLLELQNFFMTIHFTPYKNVIIGGDFNVWFDCPGSFETLQFMVILFLNGFTQHVQQPTRGPHILDLVLSTPTVRINNVSVKDNTFSDHKTVLFRARYKVRNSSTDEL